MFCSERTAPSSIVPDGTTVDDREAVKGRGTFATRPFKEGELVFTEYPFIFCSQHFLEMEDDRQCYNCGRPAPFVFSNRVPYKPFTCRNTCTVIYCSTECEESAYDSGHKFLCTNEQKFGLSAEGRACWRRLREYCKQEKYRYPLMMSMVIAKYLANGERPWKHIWVPNLEMNDIQPKWEIEMDLITNTFSSQPKSKKCE